MTSDQIGRLVQLTKSLIHTPKSFLSRIRLITNKYMYCAIHNNDESSWRKLSLLPIIIYSSPLTNITSKARKERLKEILNHLDRNEWNTFTFQFLISTNTKFTQQNIRTVEDQHRRVMNYIR